MSQQDIDSFIGRLLTDDQFRQRAVKYFRQLCFEEGYQFTEEEATIISRRRVTCVRILHQYFSEQF